jgi:hypothetical protein
MISQGRGQIGHGHLEGTPDPLSVERTCVQHDHRQKRTNMDMKEAPIGLETGGKRIWAALADHYTWEEHEFPLLHEVARVVDRLDQLDVAVRADGVLGPDGRVSPPLIEARQQQLVLARLLGALRIPAETSPPDNISAMARHAATIRWKGRARAS